MGDAFRDHPTYHFLIGGQFVGHPPGWPDNPVPSDDFIEYDVTIVKPDDPIVAGNAEPENTSSTWSGWGDSNSRPPAPKAGALTKLRYTPLVER
jgi:hypothetical protein